MSSNKKKSLNLYFEEDEFLSFRKILFRKGLSVQEFFAHIMHRCIMHDQNVESFYDGALELKEEIMRKGVDLKGVKINDVDSMYDFIEKKLKGKQNETPEK